MSPSRFVAALVLAAVVPDASAEPGPMPREIRLDSFGDPLPEGAVLRLGTTRLRHGQWVRSVAFSPDGRELASASFDGTVRIWDRATGKELRRLEERIAEPQFVAYTPDGRHLITTQGWHDSPRPNGIRMWDARTGRPERSLAEQGPRRAAAVALSPDGKRLAWVDGPAVIVLDVASGRPALHIPMDRVVQVSQVAFAADSNRLAVGAETLLRKLDGPLSGEALREARAVEVLERMGSPAANALLERLAAGSPGHPLTDRAATAVRRLAH